MRYVTAEPTLDNPTSEADGPPFSQSVRVTAEQEMLRPAKAMLLPEIARLALEGHCSREIGKQMGVPRRTIDRWLRELRQQWANSAAENAAELFAVATARLESIYREAMEAWRRSLADQQLTVETVSGDVAARAKSLVRKTTQSGRAALLGKAIQAAGEIRKLNEKHLEAARQTEATQRGRARQDLVDELRGLPHEVFREIEELILQGGRELRRSPNELAEVLSSLTTEEYGRLKALLWAECSRELPRRGKEEDWGMGEEE